MQLKLTLELKPMQGSEFYNPNNAFHTNLAGIEVEYQPVPNTFLDIHGYGTRLGFREEGKIFVSKHLHPAQMPVIALYLHLKSLEVKDMEAVLGVTEGTLAGLDSGKIDDIILSSTLEYASDFLRLEEVKDLIKKFKAEPGYAHYERDVLFEEFASHYLSDKSVDALVRRSEQQLQLYTERVHDHIEKFAKSGYNKRMDGLQRLVAEYRGMGTLFALDLVKARNVYREIKESPELKQNIPSIVELLTVLEREHIKKDIEVDAAASRVLYLCSAAYVDSIKPPVTFINKPTKIVVHNIIQLSTYGRNTFIPSLKRLLMQDVIRELDELNQGINGIETVVTGIQQGQRDALSIAANYLRTTQSIPSSQTALAKPGQIITEIEATAAEPARNYRTTLAFIATGGRPEDIRTYKAGQALKLLESLGIHVSAEQVEAVAQIERRERTEDKVLKLTDGKQ